MPYSDESVYTGEYNEEPDLNFELYAEQLCRIAVKATARSKEAFTVGIFGSWGSGKTTLMRCIKNKLSDPKLFQRLFSDLPKTELTDKLKQTRCKTIWVNPWKYDGKEDVRNALIQTILGEMANDPDLEKDKRKEIMEKAMGLSLSLYRLTGHTLRGTIKALTSGGIDTKYISDEIEKAIKGGDNKAVIDPYQYVNNFEEVFKALVKNYVGDNGRLAIFIDDLDRCLPENALTVLESLKLYLAQVNCIFFIGLDKRVIEQAVSQRYRDVKITGKEYIEKIIRLNFFLPDKDPDEVKKVFQLVPIITGKYDEKGNDQEKEEAKKLWDMILQATKANLRKVEQFIIAFELIEKIVEGLNKNRGNKKPEINWQGTYAMLAKILLLQMNFPDFYDALERNYTLMEKIKKVYDDTKDEDSKLKAVQDKYSFCYDPILIEFIVLHFDYGKISSSEDWKVIHKLSKAVIYE
ncbi:P-loop NTPase fold protein [Microcoleus sp. herbarium14]|uniref:KAP family P-loop NTPase fold protein n=1 Tax=Microcoleus sp. herbarium14 TaxID=3055439 RepID=UPI002FD24B60